MKKLIFLIAITLSVNSFAQISLPQNKTLTDKMKPQLAQISNQGQYNAKVIAFGFICKFTKEDNELIYNSYFNSLQKFNLTTEESKLIRKDYEKAYTDVLKDNTEGKVTDCDKYKIEYDKIVAYFKKPK